MATFLFPLIPTKTLVEKFSLLANVLDVVDFSTARMLSSPKSEQICNAKFIVSSSFALNFSY